MTSELKNAPAPVIANKRRLPVYDIKKIINTCPTFSQILIITAALSGAMGLLYALKIWTWNGSKDCIPLNWVRKNKGNIIKNGFKARLFLNSESFSAKVGGGCEHGRFWLTHVLHDWNCSLFCCNVFNSSATVSLGTQPRNQRREFSASFVQFFDKSHWGVSGIFKKHEIFVYFYFRQGNNGLKEKKITKTSVIAEMKGIITPINARLLHKSNVLRMYATSIPIDELMLRYAVDEDRMDESL